MIGLNITSKIAGLHKLAPELKKRAAMVVASTAYAVEYDAKQLAPVDTGALKTSIYANTATKNERDDAISRASGRWAMNRWDAALPPIAPDPPQASQFRAIVAVGMAYGVYVEYGTARTAAQPFLVPAGLKNQTYFKEEMAKIWIEAAGRIL